MIVGRTLGPYEVLEKLGEGGMGVVYRAKDTNLGRDVAIKVLPDAFVSDPERTARFRREATTLASLNHPNIGGIYGLQEGDGVVALVLEFVDGPTLADRLAGGPVPLDQALPIARQIADALETAHERGIIHRDLKPANIVLTPDGVAKVLDFGLAKVLSDSIAPLPSDLTHSPTMLGPTADGVLLGTAPYMSPEQARGKAVDRRTDVWAFGCVLFELLTGRRAFDGETSSDAIAAILERQPDWTSLPPATPPAVRRLLRRCLEKDPKRRLRDIGDARLELDDESVPATATRPSSERTPVWKIAALVAATLVFSVAATVWWFSNRAPAAVRRPARFTFAAPEGTQFLSPAPVPSPDGTRIAFSARSSSGQTLLWVRSLDSETARSLPGTENIVGPPFWSPDGQWIGFAADGRLKKIDAGGGPVLTIAAMPTNLGATWNRDNVIVLAPLNRTVLHRVPAGGGTPEPITTLSAERRENSHRWPHFLPDGRHFLFTARSDVREDNMIYVGSLDSTEVTPLFPAQSGAVYVTPGYILYAREGTMMAQPVDPHTYKLTGEAFPVAAGVSHNTPSSEAAFGASADGSVLALLTNVSRDTNLTWFDRTGKSIATVGPGRDYTDVRISPDGKTAGVVIPDPDSGNRDIWLVDLAGGTLSRFTSNPANDWQLVWSPDGKRIAFASDRNGRSTVWIKPIDGGDEELLLRMPDVGAFPKDFSRDGEFLGLGIDTAVGLSGVWAMPLKGDRTPFSLSNATVRENALTFMPGGPWVAFSSAQSGDDEIYIAPFPKGGRRRVSSGGGLLPRWKPDGKELYFLAANDDIMSAPIRAGQSLEVGTPVRIVHFCGDDPGLRSRGLEIGRPYDVTPDGAKFLMPCAGPDANTPAISVAMEWAAPKR
jgi:serine/threonine protein kinase